MHPSKQERGAEATRSEEHHDAGDTEGPLRAAVEKGLPTIGTVIDVHWDDRDQWFRGRVVSRVGNRKKQARFHISYEDGDQFTHDLHDFCWRVAPINGRSGPVCRWRQPGLTLQASPPTVLTQGRTNSRAIPRARGSRGVVKPQRVSRSPAAALKQSRARKRVRSRTADSRASIDAKFDPVERTAQRGLVDFLGECIEADDEVSDGEGFVRRSRECDGADDGDDDDGGNRIGNTNAGVDVDEKGRDENKDDGVHRCGGTDGGVGKATVACKSEDRTVPPLSASSSLSHSSCAAHDAVGSGSGGGSGGGGNGGVVAVSSVELANRAVQDDSSLPCRKRSWRLHRFALDV